MRSFIRLSVRRRVVLPQPDGPMSAVTSRFGDAEVDVADGPERAVVAGHVLELEREIAARLVASARRLPRDPPRCGRPRVEPAMDRDRRPMAGSMAGRRPERRRRGLGGRAGQRSLLYHWMLRESRARTIKASALRIEHEDEDHDDRRRGDALEVGLRPATPTGRPGSAGPCSRPGTAAGRKVTKVDRSDEDEWRRLADRPGHRQDDPGHDSGRRAGQHRPADHLPARCAEGDTPPRAGSPAPPGAPRCVARMTTGRISRTRVSAPAKSV